MKRINIIATLTLAIGLFITPAVKALNPVQVTSLAEYALADIVIEKELKVQDWMLSTSADGEFAPKPVEKALELESWMIQGNWNEVETRLTAEAEIELEDWMTEKFIPESPVIAMGK
jgi:hypothetical protein